MSNKNIKFPIGAKEAAEYLKVNHRTLKYWLKQMKAPVIGNSYYIDETLYNKLKEK